MAHRYEVNGHIVEFENEPTEADIDEAAASLGNAKDSDIAEPNAKEVSDPQSSLLSEIIQQSRGYSPLGFLPTNKEEALDAGKVALRQVLPDSAGLVDVGSRLATGKGSEGLPAPQTPYGKGMEAAANTAQLTHLGKAALDTLSPATQNLINKIPRVNTALSDLEQAAHTTTLRARDAFKLFQKDLNSRFGADYQAAIGNSKIHLENEYIPALEKTLTDSGILEKSEAVLSPAERKFIRFVSDAKEELANRSAERVSKILDSTGSEIKTPSTDDLLVPVKEVDKNAGQMFEKIFGKNMGQGEHIVSVFRRNIAEILGDKVPELRLVKAKYAPELQFKNEAFKVLQPYNKSAEFDTTQGTNYFKRAATGSLMPDEKILLKKFTEKYDPTMLDGILATGKRLKAAQTLDAIMKNVQSSSALLAKGALIYGGYSSAKHLAD